MCAARTETKNNDRLDYGLYFSDGLLDIFLGLGLVMAGILMFGELIFLMGVFPAVMLPAWQAGRNKTLARIRVVLGDPIPGAYQSRNRAVLLGLMIAGLLTFMLGISVFFAYDRIPLSLFAWLEVNYWVVVGVIAALAFSVCGLVLGTPRFYLYAAGSLTLFVACHLVGIVLPVGLIALGVSITGFGILTLMRFLGEYPAS